VRLRRKIAAGLLTSGTIATAMFAMPGMIAAQQVAAASLYTQEQASRGTTSYLRSCGACHGEQFNGAESGPSLAGAEFKGRWQGKTVGDLYQRIRTTMPPLPDTPGKLPPQEYADIVAAILSSNGMAAGASDLKPDSPGMQTPLS
jgi:mono/diheme cytochrome c family protein